MPRLLGFLPCERALISREDDTVTLITVLQGIQAALTEEARGKKPLRLPMRGSVLASWSREPGDEGGTSGATLVEQSVEFEFVKQTHNQIGNIFGFPVEGFTSGDQNYTLRLSLRRVGDADFAVVADYPFRVNVSVSSSNAAHA